MDKICELCTGCRTCEKVCPKQAIEMKEDDEGFLIPKIDKNKCVDCNLCKNRCPQNNNIKIKDYCGKAYATQHLNKEILLESSSGGFFSALAAEIIKLRGVVFGATIDDNLKVYHCSIKSEQDLKLLRSSKYVASDVLDTYKEVKKYLDENILVLYSGLPCQIAGLRSYLNKEYSNLITVDVICHGTPSYKLFDTYRQALESKLNSKIQNYKFRDKSKRGWGVYWSFGFNDNKKQKNGGLNDDPYISTFIKGTANKEACYKCKYVGFENRPGDITLGDYWGIDVVHPEMASNDGVSAVIVNSEKAIEIVDKALKNCKYIETEKEKIAKFNESLIKAENRPEKRNYIYQGLNELNPQEFVKKNLKISYKDFFKTKVRLLLPYKFRVILKKINRGK